MNEEISEAIRKDLGRGRILTELAETTIVRSQVLWDLNNVDWMAADVIMPTELGLAPGTTKLRYEPLGVCGVLGAWNFPLRVTLLPMV
jgi:aldehyde dehydrogenase (NAD+)